MSGIIFYSRAQILPRASEILTVEEILQQTLRLALSQNMDLLPASFRSQMRHFKDHFRNIKYEDKLHILMFIHPRNKIEC